MYRREAGEYMGVKIPKDQAIEHSELVLSLKHDLPFIVQRTSDQALS
jgi:hypothetical protein